MPKYRGRTTTPLPGNWDRLRLRIARRDHNLCQLDYPGCLGYCPPGDGGECDHITDPHDHTPANLRWVCEPCHAQLTHQANTFAQSRRRQAEPHPGAN